MAGRRAGFSMECMRAWWVILGAVIVLAMAFGAWLTRPVDGKVHALAELKQVMTEVEAAHPQCADFEKLRARRTPGTNGWPELRAAARVADKLLNGKSHAAATQRISNSDWFEVAEPAHIIAETNALAAMTRRALQADSLVDPGLPSEQMRMLELVHLVSALQMRVMAHATNFDLPQARQEALDLVRLATRLDYAKTMLEWSLQALLRKHVLLWLAEHLPRLEPDAAYRAEIENAIAPEMSIETALEAELAALLWHARKLVEDFERDEKDAASRGNESGFIITQEYMNVHTRPLRAISAALTVLKQHGGLDAAPTVEAVVEAARPWAGDGTLGIMEASRIRRSAAAGIEMRAAEFALRVRCGNEPERIAALLAEKRFELFRVQQDGEDFKVFVRPDTGISAVIELDATRPLVDFKLTPAPAMPLDPKAEPQRRFR